jgi:hypothetical protein
MIMKMKKSMGAVALALGFASAAEAQQAVYITGSTAFRAQVYHALADLGLSVSAGATTGNNSFTFSGTVNASVENYSGGTYDNLTAGKSYQVFCTFSGSSEGVYSLLNDVSPVYTNISGASTTYANGADLAFCDVQQASTQYPTPGLSEVSTADGIASSFGAGVAIVPFTWAASAGANGKVINVTPYLLNDIFPAGALPLSFFDGVASDAGANVVLVGRTNDSGTRITAELTDGLPTASFDPAQGIIQYAPGGISGLNAGTYTGTFQELGSSANTEGYSSGSGVAKALSQGTGDAIGYVAWSDSASLSGGALPITFAGSNPSTVYPITSGTWTANSTPWNLAGLENGQYYFWSYEHCYVSPAVESSGTSPIAKDFAPDLLNALEHEIVTTTPQTADVIGRMNVNKGNDGGDINPGN